MIELSQKGLIERIITAVGLEGATSKSTPAECGALASDKDGDPCNADFNYASIVGMLMYLCANTRPDLTFAVHQYARFSPRARRTRTSSQTHWSLSHRDKDRPSMLPCPLVCATYSRSEI